MVGWRKLEDRKPVISQKRSQLAVEGMPVGQAVEVGRHQVENKGVEVGRACVECGRGAWSLYGQTSACDIVASESVLYISHSIGYEDNEKAVLHPQAGRCVCLVEMDVIGIFLSGLQMFCQVEIHVVLAV